jgi:peptidyl-prolyl cis-trans isomerase A (cyclophilin A)
MFGGPSFEKSDYKEDLDRIYASFHTNMGSFQVELYAKECPETVWNFVNLAEGRQETVKEGPFYDGLNFHRVISGFVIQGGCPQGSGMGGPGYQFKDECHRDLPHSDKGILSMANAGPGTNGSQFFITLGPTPHLNGRHTVFGKVIKGLDVVDEIGNVATGAMDRPNEDVIMEKVEIHREL